MTSPSFNVSVNYEGKESKHENMSPKAFVTFLDNLKFKNRHTMATATDQDGNVLYEKGQWII